MLRVSNDTGQTFGPMMMLDMNGTINNTTGNTAATTITAEDGGESIEEEAVGGPEVAE